MKRIILLIVTLSMTTISAFSETGTNVNHVISGIKLMQEGAPRLAALEFRNTIVQNPDNVKLYAYLGMACRMAGS